MFVKCHRQADASQKKIYLTFDDGPEPATTSEVLKILDKHAIKGTFFVVVEKAEQHPDLLQKIVSGGHAIGNHSLNHVYRPFFSGRKTMLNWIGNSETRLQAMTGKPSIGWRSPAGIQTPPMHYALKQLGLPLIHWDTRYFDSVKKWTWQHAEQSLDSIVAGSIVLLHDKQKQQNQDTFLATLDRFIGVLLERGYKPDRLERSDLL